MKMQSLFFRGTIPHETFKFIIKSDHDFVNTTNEVSLTQLKDEVKFGVQPKAVIARTIVEVINCTTINGTACGFNFTTAYTRLSIMKSHFTDVLIVVVGWAYFFAWSISFYPQMILNYQRKSVVGLNFDFLFLNIIGFSAYTIYNSMHYWDTDRATHERSPLPVLLNDVIFALHALAACLITAVQACLYERENQRVHPGFIFYGGALVVLGFLALFLSLISVITYLQFVTSLSYIKMAVTCMKYFPQAVYNYKRKSTVGWSIGNVLLDFTGGLLDVMQMVLQAWNVDDWSAFYGNPVKFGLGMVSMVFDVVFLLQHYAFYRNAEILPQYAGVDNPLPQSLNDSLTQSPPQQTDDPSRIRANSRENISISRD
ncbi:unnamed protein product, partial [Mesorhabditis belari]|uniref:Cystinosin n=1 Tax=Mesorhabditis belari TaxID=2138241 RepID=A0AAF3EZM0_9BILA